MKKILILLLALLFVLGISAQICQARSFSRPKIEISPQTNSAIAGSGAIREYDSRMTTSLTVRVTVIVDHPDNIPVTIKCFAQSERGSLTGSGFVETQFGRSAVFSIPRGWDALIMAHDSELGDCAVLENLFSDTTVRLGDNWGILSYNE